MDHTLSHSFYLISPCCLPFYPRFFASIRKKKIGLFRLLSNQTNKPVFRLVETFYEFDVEIYVLYPFCKTEPLFGFFNFHKNARFLPFITPSGVVWRHVVYSLVQSAEPPLSAIYQASRTEPLHNLKTLHEKNPAHETRGIKMKGGRLPCFQIIVRRLFGFIFRRFFLLVGGLFGFIFRRFFLLIRRRFIFNRRFSFRFDFCAS